MFSRQYIFLNYDTKRTKRDFLFIDGKYVNRLYYSMLKDEYESGKTSKKSNIKCINNMGLSKLKLADLNDADLSQLTITYKSWGQVWNNQIEIGGDGCCTVSVCFEEKQLRLSQHKVISLLNKIVSCGFFELNESRPNFSIESKAGKLILSQFDILDGLSQSLTLRIGNKQRCFESYFDSCTAMDSVFKELDKLITQAKKS